MKQSMKSVLCGVALLPIIAQASIKMAITVDDLPSHGSLPPHVTRVEVAKAMLATLKANRIPEVYGFINAGKVEKDKSGMEVLNLWLKAGYPLGNHTFSHRDENKVSTEEFEKEIDFNEPLLQKLAGDANWHYFRYPFLHEGDTPEKRNAIRRHLKEKAYTIAQVTDDFEDWAWNDPYARCKAKDDITAIESLKKSYLKAAEERLVRDETIARALYKRPIAHILLMHIGAFDAVMLPDLIAMYLKNGVEFIPLSEAVKDSIYKDDPRFTTKSGDDFTYQVMTSRDLTLKDVGLNGHWKFPGKQLEATCK